MLGPALSAERRLILYRSNRLEALLDCLVRQLAQDPPPPLIAECVVVQSRGMATWLSQQLAVRFGVWANPQFPHPRRFIQQLLRAALGPEAESAASFSRELLTLAILQLLPQLVEQDDFTPLRRYLEQGDDDKSLQLARQIAYTFDQYLVYRPDLVLAWEGEREWQGKDGAGEANGVGGGSASLLSPGRLGENRWQALLWRQLAEHYGSPARIFHQAHERLQTGRLAAPELLPARLFLFGITTLPPLYLNLLYQAARLRPCHLLLFAPARGYWADITSPQAVNRLLLRSGQPTAADLHLETGHPLLASWGTVGREFQEILEDTVEYEQPPDGDNFVDPTGPESTAANDPFRGDSESDNLVDPMGLVRTGQGGEGRKSKPGPLDYAARAAAGSLLARLQRDILELRHPGRDDVTDFQVQSQAGGYGVESGQRQQPAGPGCSSSPGYDRGPAGAADSTSDDSIIIHSCHSPLREVEVLQDQLLAMLDGEGLQPREIVVMVPDIETYAPLIEAVFRRPAGDRRYIPFRIADRKISREAPLLDALAALFELVRGRLPRSRVLDFLAREPVQKGWGLDGDQLRRIGQWLDQAQVRWGIDEEHRRSFGLPPDRQNTWRFGLDRLILGYALPGEDRHLVNVSDHGAPHLAAIGPTHVPEHASPSRLPQPAAPRDRLPRVEPGDRLPLVGSGDRLQVNGILPLDDIEGQDAHLAGILLKFSSALFELAEEVQTPKSPEQWGRVVRQALAAFFGPEQQAAGGEEWQRQSLRDALTALLEDSARAGLERPLELPAFLRLLQSRLDEAGISAGFLAGGLTFCTMLPMRTIPFPVVCLLGMNDGDFPRRDNPAGFDLLAAAPRSGDRSRRRDDRYLFLESLLAARHRLYISYVGRSIRDNTALPPSTLVAELLDCLALMNEGQAREGQAAVVTDPACSSTVGAAAETVASPPFSSTQPACPANAAPAVEKVVCPHFVEHPLQPFSSRYFQAGHPQLFTYAAEYAAIPANLAEPRIFKQSAGFAGAGSVNPLNPTLADLHRFFRNPAKWYAQNHLGVVLPRDRETRPDREPVFLEGREQYRLNRLLMRDPAALTVGVPAATVSASAAASPDPPTTAPSAPPAAPVGWRQILAARGELPLAGAAGPALEEIIATIEPMAAFLATKPGGPPLPDLALDLDLGPDFRLGGELRDRAQAALLRATVAMVSPEFFLAAWLDHLVLCALAPPDQDRQCIMVGRNRRDKSVAINIYREVATDRARHLLGQLAELWRQGQQAPLPLFSESSQAWCGKILDPKNEDQDQAERQARRAALDAYHGNAYENWRADGRDPYIALIFQEADPAGDRQESDPAGPGGVAWADFAEVAQTVYAPMLQALEKVEPECL